MKSTFFYQQKRLVVVFKLFIMVYGFTQYYRLFLLDHQLILLVL